MAEPIDIIAKLSVDASGVFSEIDKVNAKYAESNKELRKTQNELDNLLLKEKKLLTARTLSTNPTATAQYNKELDKTRTKIEVQQKLVEQLTASQKKYEAELTNTSQKLNKAFDTTKVNATNSSLLKLAGGLGLGLGLAAVASGIKNVAEESFNLAAKAEGIQTAFRRIGGDLTLEKLRIATRGATSDLELMQAALRAQNFGISTDLLAKGLELAGKVARTTGQDVTFLTNSFVDGLGRKSIRILDNLQISQVQLQEEIKRTGDFNTAVGNIIDKKLKETGDVALTTADKIAKISSAFENIKTKVGEVLVDMGNSFVSFFEVAFGSKTIADVQLENLLSKANKIIQKLNGEQLDKAKESEASRTQLIVESNNRIIKDAEKVINAKNRSDREYYRLVLRLEQQLNQDLRKLGQKRTEELTDEEQKRLEIIKNARNQLKDLEATNITDDFQRQRSQLTIKANREIESIKVTGKLKEAIIAEINTRLGNEIEAVDKKEIESNAAKLKKIQDAIDDAIFKHLESTQKLLQEQVKLQAVDLAEEERHQLALSAIAEKSVSFRLAQEIVFEQKKLDNLKASGIATEQEITSQNNTIEEKNKALLKAIADEKKKTDEKEKEERKKEQLEIIGLIETEVKAVEDAAERIINAEVKKVDRLISLQQKRVDEAKNIADKGNADLLELEKERLDKLNKEKERFVRQQQSLATIELVTNSAIAISKAAAEGGAAAPITIAATLIALIAGLAEARSIASQAAFYKGGYTGDGNPSSESLALGKKSYTYHNAEFVHNYQTTKKYRDIFQNVHEGKVDLNEWKSKVELFDMLKLNNIDTSRQFMMPMVNNNSEDISKLKSSMENVVSAIKAQPGMIVNIDDSGIFVITNKYYKNQQRINNITS